MINRDNSIYTKAVHWLKMKKMEISKWQKSKNIIADFSPSTFLSLLTKYNSYHE
jgi:hypothetical protein